MYRKLILFYTILLVNAADDSSADETTILEASGTFIFTMSAYTSYTNSLLSGSITSFPVEIPLRERLFFKVTINGPAELNLKLGILDIVASSSSDMSDPSAQEYKIMENGCAVDLTYEVVTLTDQSEMEQSFSVEAFEFTTDTAAEVFIHAGVIVCEENATECGESCLDRKKRKKRRRRSDHEEFYTYNGPFVFVGDKSDNKTMGRTPGGKTVSGGVRIQGGPFLNFIILWGIIFSFL